MAGQHHRYNEHELGQNLGDDKGQGGLAYCVHGVTKSGTQLGNWTIMTTVLYSKGFLGGARVKEPACQCRRHKRYGFKSWVGKIFWWRKWQPTLVSAWRSPWTEEPGRLQCMGSQTQSK